MPADSRPSPVHDDTMSPGTRIQDLIVEQWVRAVPDGHQYRVVHAATGRGATLLEYLPNSWARRHADGVKALPGHGQDFQAGLRRFMMKARQLKALEHPALPVLLDAWSSQGTAYALLSPLPAQTLAEVVAAQGGRLRLEQAWPWMCACFDLAEWLHRQGKIHAAWEPDAIWVQEDQRLVMAAPEVDGGVRPASPWVAIEQTTQAPSGIKCGPWTDVFGIAAIAAYMLTGQTPATARRLPLAAWMPPVPPGGRKPAGEPPPRALLAAIRVSLLPNPRQRPQDIAQLKAMMGLGPQLPMTQDRDGSMPSEAEDSSLDGDTVPMHELPDIQPPQAARVAAAAAVAASAVPSAAELALSEAETQPIPLVAEPVDADSPATARVAAFTPAAPVATPRARRSPSALVLAGLAFGAVVVAWLATRPVGAPDSVAGHPATTSDRSLDHLLQTTPPAAGPAAAAAAPPAAPAPAAAIAAAASPPSALPVPAGVASGSPGSGGGATDAPTTGGSARDEVAHAAQPPSAGAADARRPPATPGPSAKPGTDTGKSAAAGRRLTRCSQALLEQSLGGAGAAADLPKECR